MNESERYKIKDFKAVNFQFMTKVEIIFLAVIKLAYIAELNGIFGKVRIIIHLEAKKKHLFIFDIYIHRGVQF